MEMAKFIEVTYQDENHSSLVNANEIYRIEPNPTKGCALSIKTSISGRDYYIVSVKESYQNIRSQLEVAPSEGFGN